MVRRRRKSLERDSQLLAEAVPIMRAALDELEYLRLQLRVCAGENAKLQKAYRLQGYQVVELIEANDQLLLDQTAYSDEDEDQSDEWILGSPVDPTSEPFA